MNEFIEEMNEILNEHLRNVEKISEGLPFPFKEKAKANYAITFLPKLNSQISDCASRHLEKSRLNDSDVYRVREDIYNIFINACNPPLPDF